ncbi:MAG TPA: hypothetical protein VHS31_13990 [Tepidisphaeraceae bacterium]|jgi:hypothetical protein|nr:hypothetical protein [Tepidisphaeraceae bacterium]
MSTIELNPLQAFHWEPQPQAERFVRGIVDEFLSRNEYAAELARRMKEETGTRFYDWIAYITLRGDDGRVSEMEGVGYAKQNGVYQHGGGMFPPVVVGEGKQMEIGVKVESVVDFLAANGLEVEIVGGPLSNVRKAVVGKENGTSLVVMEKNGARAWDQAGKSSVPVTERLSHLEKLRTRRRDFENDAEGFAHLNQLLDAAIKDLGRDLTCDLFFAAEREYWQRKNRAAQVQKGRQDKLGMGWANHDHHTYRSSREHFKDLVAVHEKLGLVCRERFYAGKEAGWGAQVMEQPVTGIITFNDVDLSPEELVGDFSHELLAKRKTLGTVGLWCALHGEAILQAGMHHLEAQFDFESLRDQLEKEDVRTMKPFTNFTYLRQAFTEGERWKVSERRIARALAAGYISEEQAKQFREQGAIGSHLENLERNEGFKGFNQTGVSEIIAATDPRKHVANDQ